MGFQEDVVSATRTNLARIVVAALLALSACLVVWWPQGAAGSDGAASASAAATTSTAQPTKTPSVTVSASPTRTPSVTISSAAPPPAAPSTNSSPTSKPSSRDGGHSTGGHSGNSGGNQGPNTIGNNNSGNNSSGNSGGGKPNGSKPSTPTTVVSTPAGTVTNVEPDVDASDPPPPADTGAAGPKGGGKGQTTKTPKAEPTEAVPTDDGSLKVVGSTETYETSAEPVETKGAPVWVVPGILLMLTSMLALLGGVLGRNKRPVRVKDEA